MNSENPRNFHVYFITKTALTFQGGKCFSVLFVLFIDRFSLHNSGCPGTHSVDQAGLKLRDPLASDSQVPGSKV